MRIGLEIEVSDKELLGRLANVKEKKEALDRAMAQLESCITSRYEAKANGYDIGDGTVQLYWIDQLSESTGEWIKTSAYNLTWSQFKTSTETPEYLASAYLKNFERAGVEEEEARRQYARSWYDFLESGVEPAGRYIVRFIPA